MERKFEIEQMSDCRWFYNFKDKTKNGETLTIEINKVTNPGGKNSLPYLWYKHKFIDRILESYWCIDTYVVDKENNSYRRYNPTVKDGKINFDWKFEATEENLKLILDEIIRLAYTN